MVIRAVLPAVRLREAAAVNLGSTAVANTLPAGGAVAMCISWAMLCSWGVSAADYVLYTLVSGIWNVFARLGLPVIALLAIVTVSRPQAGLLAGAFVGLALLIIVAVGFSLLLRSESLALRAGAALQPALAVACRLTRRSPPGPAPGSLLSFRERAVGLLAERGWRVTAATAASNVCLWLVLLASVRGVIAAVLLYRAVTYLAPIPIGALACLAWRYAPAFRRGGIRLAAEPRLDRQLM